MKIGAHVSAAGGVDKSVERAHDLGCECFQIFSRSPQGGSAPELTKEVVANFKAELKKYKINNFYIHTPYFINFASSKRRVAMGSIQVVREELERGSLLGAKYVMTHLGSAKDFGLEKSIQLTIIGFKELLKNYTGSCELLIEMSAGSGAIIGSSFEEVAKLFEGVKHKKLSGVCFDTAHMYATGYDFRTTKALNKTLAEFDSLIGIDRLKLIHANDSKVELGSRIDRHANIGQGKLGLKAFEILIADKRLKNIDLILETPGDEERLKDVKLLKKIRKNKLGH